MRIIALLLILISFAQCQSTSGKLSYDERAEFLLKGDSVTTSAQRVLLQNVAMKIQEAGAPGAVDYCNEKALFLTDSISESFGHTISRLSNKNRNPNNAIQNTEDKNAWLEIEKRMKDENDIAKHFVVQEGNNIYYYKAISIAMPTCLKCHGDKENDITSETLQKIQEKYPSDKAVGYAMGDLRGMWKVKLR